MKFLESQAAFLAAMAVSILAFGGGLTSPIWLIVAGRQPLDAIHAGTPIVAVTIVGLIVTVILGLVVNSLRKPPPIEATAPVLRTAEPSRTKSLVIEIVVMLMFIIPFVTIVIGYLLHKMIDFTAT